MRAKVIKNLNLDTNEICYGIAFQVCKGAQYCKYIIGKQNLPDKETANSELKIVQEKLDSLSEDQRDFINRQPINKHQYVNI